VISVLDLEVQSWKPTMEKINGKVEPSRPLSVELPISPPSTLHWELPDERLYGRGAAGTPSHWQRLGARYVRPQKQGSSTGKRGGLSTIVLLSLDEYLGGIQ
jgi:hypothetical protein